MTHQHPLRGARAGALTLAMTAAAALLAGPAMASGTAPGAGATSYDISFPQCGTTFPTVTSFAIAGVNDGRPGTLNPCLGGSSAATGELAWDQTSGYPELYVNTADPGNSYHHQLIADWPTSSVSSDPYGSCSTVPFGHGPNATTVGANSTGCAWQYGYNTAQGDEQDVTAALPAGSTLNAGDFPYWLDVETANTWQTGSYGLAMNTAVLQGMAYYFANPGPGTTATTTGVYSTSYQWGQITGTPASGTTPGTLMNLSGVPDWVPGASDQAGAQTMCGTTPFTGGAVAMTQWTATLDQDLIC